MLTVGTMSWAVRPSPSIPLCKIDGFNGTFNFVANSALPGVLKSYTVDAMCAATLNVYRAVMSANRDKTWIRE